MYREGLQSKVVCNHCTGAWLSTGWAKAIAGKDLRLNVVIAELGGGTALRDKIGNGMGQNLLHHALIYMPHAYMQELSCC